MEKWLKKAVFTHKFL